MRVVDILAAAGEAAVRKRFNAKTTTSKKARLIKCVAITTGMSRKLSPRLIPRGINLSFYKKFIEYGYIISDKMSIMYKKRLLSLFFLKALQKTLSHKVMQLIQKMHLKSRTA